MSHQSARRVAGNVSSPLPAASPISLKVNGVVKQIKVRPWVTLLDLLRELTTDRNLTTVMVTHDHEHLATADAVIELTDGRIATLADGDAVEPGVVAIASTR